MKAGLPERTTGGYFQKGSPVSLPEDSRERALRFGLTPDKSTKYSSEPHALQYEHSAGTVYEHCSSNVYKYLSFKTLEELEESRLYRNRITLRGVRIYFNKVASSVGPGPNEGSDDGNGSINEGCGSKEAFQGGIDSRLRRTLVNGPCQYGVVCSSKHWKGAREGGFIAGVPEVMKISSFMDAHKCSKLAKRYSDKVPKTVNEMIMRLDDFIRLEEAFASMELPKGEVSKTPRRPSGSLRRQLEMAIESRKLNHLIKDARQRGRGNVKGRDAGKDKVIIMIRLWPNDRKRKSVERYEKWMKAPIVFHPLSMKDASDDPLIIEAVMKGYLVRRVYVDQGASVEVMFEHCFKNLSPTISSRLRDPQMDLVGFAGGVVIPLGKIKLEVVFGDGRFFRMVMINFIVVRAPSPYNIIFGRAGLRSLRAVSSTIHSMVKFLTPRGVATLVTRSAIISECRRLEKKQMVDPEVNKSITQMKGVLERVDLTKQTLVNPAYPDQLGTYCYTKMPFRLKNAGATYQRLVDTAFQSQIERNLEAYVDDMVIKSNDKKILIKYIAETFDNLRRINMRLYPKNVHLEWKKGKMQSLSGKPAALKRFLFWSAKKSLPFFETLKDIMKESKDEYRWTKSTEKTFQERKKVTLELPLLSTLVNEETLYVYVAVAVLLAERKGKQCPIHYMSRTINEAERNYAPLEKLALSLLHMFRRLRRHFEAHPIKFIRDQPLKQILKKAQASEKLAKYSVELGAYNIAYELRNAMKGQVLVDFLSEAPVGTPAEEFFRLSAESPNIDEVERWTLFTNGASNSKGSRDGLVIISPSGVEFTYAFRLNFTSTNNEAQYEALLAGLRMISGSYMASSTSMIKYLATVKECIVEFTTFIIQNIPRNSNQKVDILSKLATHAFDHLTKELLVEVLAERSTDRKEVGVVVEEEEDNWMTPIIRCMGEGVWPEDKDKRRALRIKINQYILEEGVLIKKGVLGNAYRRKVRSGEGYKVGILLADHAQGRHKHDAEMRLMPGARSSTKTPQNFDDFNHGSVAILPMGHGHTVSSASSSQKIEIWHLTDNETQFVNDPFKGWYEYLNIKQMNTAIAYPPTNGLVERTNKSLMEGIKARLGKERAGWVDELPNVLWGHRTSLKQSNGKIPFSLTYRSEAVIPAEIWMPTHQTMMIREDENEDELRLNMDLLQEMREAAAIREAKYKTKIEQYHNQ
uniref:Integrase catalytic domain-containing protein n=1 Tax=Tanacetum cinerariifolium TaxID=118510 RepID=A0A6L2NR30_TANCI|nr:hypothetical protein [Tanacetum cinerariifolium]